MFQSEPVWPIWFTRVKSMTESLSTSVAASAPFDSDQSRQVKGRFEHHRGPVTCVAGIPGRPAAVTSGYDSAVGLVDFEQETIELLGYHRHLVNRVVVNDSGSLAATCSSDYTACLWDLEALKPVRVLRGHWDDVEDFAFVDDNTGITVSRDRRIFIWNLRTGAVEQILEKHQRDVLSVEYADGKIYSSGDDMTLRQWDLASGELQQTWGPFEVETDTCTIDPINQRAILGCDDGCIRIFDCSSGELVQKIDAHQSGIKKVAVSPNNGDILSAAYDQRILIWDAGSLELKQELQRHAATWERSFNWSPDGQNILAGTFDGTVLYWKAESGRLMPEIGRQNEADGHIAGNACFNDVSAADNGHCAIVSDDGYLRMAHLSAAASRWTQTIEPQSGRMLMNAVCLAEPLVLNGSHDQKLHVHLLSNEELTPLTELSMDEGPVNCIRMLPRNGGLKQAFAACYSGKVVRISLENLKNIHVAEKYEIHDGAVKSLRIHPLGHAGVSGAADGSMFAWSVGGEILRPFVGHTAIVDDVDFDPTGKYVASVSRDFTVNVYEFESGLMRHSILLGRESPKCVLFWDTETVIVGNYWGDLWRVDLVKESVTPHRIAINGISALSRSGENLVAVSYDGSASLVDPENLSVLSHLGYMRQKLKGFEQKASFD